MGCQRSDDALSQTLKEGSIPEDRLLRPCVVESPGVGPWRGVPTVGDLWTDSNSPCRLEETYAVVWSRGGGLGVETSRDGTGDGTAAAAHPRRDGERGTAILSALLQRVSRRGRPRRWPSRPGPAHATCRSHAYRPAAWRAFPRC